MSEETTSFNNIFNGKINADVLLKALENFKGEITKEKLENFFKCDNSLEYKSAIKLLRKCENKIFDEDFLNMFLQKYNGEFNLYLISEILQKCNDEICKDEILIQLLGKIKLPLSGSPISPISPNELHDFILFNKNYKFNLNTAQQIFRRMQASDFFCNFFSNGILLIEFLDKIDDENASQSLIINTKVSFNNCKLLCSSVFQSTLTAKHLQTFLNLGFRFDEKILDSYNNFQDIVQIFDPNIFSDNDFRDKLKDDNAKEHFDKICESYRTYTKIKTKKIISISLIILGVLFLITAIGFGIATLAFGFLPLLSTAAAIGITAGLSAIGFTFTTLFGFILTNIRIMLALDLIDITKDKVDVNLFEDLVNNAMKNIGKKECLKGYPISKDLLLYPKVRKKLSELPYVH